MAKKANGNADTGNEVVTTAEKLRKGKAQVMYLNGEGVESNSPKEGVVAIRFKFANGVNRDIGDGEFNSHVIDCAKWQGLATRIQRSYQNEKEIDKVIEAVDETIADLKNGVWIELGGDGEPKVTMLATAVKLALEDSGETVDADRFKSIIDKLANEDYRKKARANAVVAAHVANLKLESARQRAMDAMKAAQSNSNVNELLA